MRTRVTVSAAARPRTGAVADGQTALAPDLIDRLVRDYSKRRAAPSPVLGDLTEHETAVLREVASGRPNAEIAERLYVSEATVKTHVAAILRKVQARDRTQAAVAAYELGLVRPGG
ncbi:response regulator transcription factor [Nocardioides limicola]|uniref:response regulator transcription factor n=1 Tax=Nocardioides limicola TaxID=2803368 RepID=UPI00193C318F|nr:response regulator transcription factor [Nocardioides sp. DJM-14]